MDAQMKDLLKNFPPISLSEMQGVKLMNRVDTKYLVARVQLPAILKRLESDYFVQTSEEGVPYSHYQTLYYDTPQQTMYHVHHAGKLHRQKLRARIYCDTQDVFCEVKTKNNKKRTKKKRIPIPMECYGNMLEDPDIRDFVSQKLEYDVCQLVPQLENNFDRITLVNRDKTERLTIDSHLCFYNRYTGESAEIPHLVIIELKQDGNYPSFFKQVLADMRIHPHRISKYCLGTMLTNSSVKRNRFKKKMRRIAKLAQLKEA